MKKFIFYILIGIALIFVIQACKTYYFRSNYKEANSLIHETNNLRTKPFLKAHLKNGDVCILTDNWSVDTNLNIVIGYGTQYDFNRKQTFEGSIRIPFDSVAIFETNVKIQNPESGRITALSIMTGLDIVLGVICLANPKACFGSCPTFYIHENDNFHYADAEGFTNAISPSLEYDDIDSLNNHRITNNVFSITMKNEALETHCVKIVKILAYPLEQGERVYQSPTDHFYLCENTHSLSLAQAEDGNITSLLKNQDRQERFSFSDEINLSSKEEIYLTYDNVKKTEDFGLILHFRQTLLTTYLFYSAMGYMGDEVSDIFAILENHGDVRNKFDGSTKELGGIEVYIWNDHKQNWVYQDEFFETGPIAINRQFIPLKYSPSSSTVKIKLVLNKGLWRIDYAALTNIKNQVTPIEILPLTTYNKGKLDNKAMSEINSPGKYLLSLPGSEYKFNFELPNANSEYEFFLYSKGYYLEWMREDWIQEKNLKKLRQMVEDPKNYLREEAKSYKQYETIMEQEFWNSKIDTKIFSYHEN